MIPFDQLSAIKTHGRNTFLHYGAGSATRHSYTPGTVEHTQFQLGFTEAQHETALRFQQEEHAYRQLTLREAESDRAWAERLSTQHAN